MPDLVPAQIAAKAAALDLQLVATELGHHGRNGEPQIGHEGFALPAAPTGGALPICASRPDTRANGTGFDGEVGSVGDDVSESPPAQALPTIINEAASRHLTSR